ncbi:hypothetical protein E2562_031592 [Oryza meyeriana var. granulata]|uniref:Uncharacterized protein n=1 Tax=Oryza meyeriana var. granulata TaxID=110450 RepID=A0A6G1CID3_9ORYZ|nr:hypothetical protein E2562_031592 [Oryza meyeriana var. granulata]
MLSSRKVHQAIAGRASARVTEPWQVLARRGMIGQPLARSVGPRQDWPGDDKCFQASARVAGLRHILSGYGKVDRDEEPSAVQRQSRSVEATSTNQWHGQRVDEEASQSLVMAGQASSGPAGLA